MPALVTPPFLAGRCRGFDVSRYSGNVNFQKAKDEGFDFTIIRSTINVTLDSSFKKYVAAARKAGLIVGTYHALFDNADPVTQAEFYFEICKDEGLTEKTAQNLIPCGDYEIFHFDGRHPERVPAAERVKSAQKTLVFHQAVESLWGSESFLYTYPSFFDLLPTCEAKSKLATRKLAIAHYGAKFPRIPKPFLGWDLWQHEGTTPMFDGFVDLDCAQGGLSTLPTLAPYLND